MRRTQLYLDDELWRTLHVQARRRHSTISQLVRDAVRQKYLPSEARRKEAMEAVIGLWSDRRDIRDSTAYVRKLRRGDRRDRAL